MSKPRSPAAAYAVYLAVRIFICLVHALSPDTARKLPGGLAWLAYGIDHRHRLVALDNLRQAFPGSYSASELDTLVRRVYQHFCNLLMEIVLLPRKLHVGNWRRHLDL